MRILITGANRGIGLELVRMCAARGDRVFAGCRSPEHASALRELSVKYPGLLSLLSLDISNAESISRCLEQVSTETNALDLLINNAAIYSAGETLRTFDSAKAMEMLHINALGQIQVTQKSLNLLKIGSMPKVVNITSESGSVSTMTQFRGYYYFGSKAAMNMFSRCLAWDPDTEGIVTVAFHPGWVRTDMGGADADLSVIESAEGILKVIAALTPADNGKFYTWDGKEYPW